MAFQLVRRARIVMLMVSACPESGFLDAPRGAGPLANGIELSGPHAPPDALPVPRRTSLPCLADAGWMACR